MRTATSLVLAFLVQAADGHTVRATFREWLWLLGQAEVQVDDAQPVAIPLF